MSLENKLEQATGAKAKEVVEDAKGAVEGAVEGLKNAFK